MSQFFAAPTSGGAAVGLIISRISCLVKFLFSCEQKEKKKQTKKYKNCGYYSAQQLENPFNLCAFYAFFR
jgi:hypothetical protein